MRDAGRAIAPARAYVCYAAAGSCECLLAGYPPIVVAPEHTLVWGNRRRSRAPRVSDVGASVALVAVIRAPRARAMKFFAPDALLPDGWARDVAIDVDDDGTIARSRADAAARNARSARGPVVPAMPNLHSHAFQRALAGRTGTTSPSHDDSFWTWRQAMYAFLDRVDADAFEAIAAQAYVEMAKAGYASVAEFHYVHHDSAGKPYDDPAELAWRVVAAARAAGARSHAAAGVLRARGLRRHADDGGTAALRAHDLHVHASVRALAAGQSPTHGYVLGVAPHSLRAVTPEEMGHVVRLAAPDAPVHIHAAEQTQGGRRLLRVEPPASGRVAAHAGERRRALVHRARDAHDGKGSGGAGRERRGGRARADDRSRPGRWHLSGPRLSRRRRSVRRRQRFEHDRRPVRGTAAARVVAADARAQAQRARQRPATRRSARRCGRARRAAARRRWRSRSARSRPGVAPTWSCSNPADPALAGQAADDVLDAAIFGPSRAPVRDVMAGGKWIVRDGHHAAEEEAVSPATAPRLRASTPRDDARALRPAAGRRAPRHDARERRALRRDPRRRGRRRSAARSRGWAARGDVPRDVAARRTRLRAAARWLTPGLVDCHTHLVYAGNRAGEFERRQHGRDATPTSPARAAASTRRCARRARRATAELAAQSRPRLAALAAEGVTTVEIKSGYGLDTATELKQLRVARALGGQLDVDVRTTLLAAHALPPEFAGRADDYIDYVCRDMIPAVAQAGAADAVDAYLRDDRLHARADAARVRGGARASACPSSCTPTSCPTLGGAALAAAAGALSADHLEYTNAAGVAAMARAATVAVLLPGAFYALRETQLPPIAAFRERGRADGRGDGLQSRARRPRRRCC